MHLRVSAVPALTGSLHCGNIGMKGPSEKWRQVEMKIPFPTSNPSRGDTAQELSKANWTPDCSLCLCVCVDLCQMNLCMHWREDEESTRVFSKQASAHTWFFTLLGSPVITPRNHSISLLKRLLCQSWWGILWAKCHLLLPIFHFSLEKLWCWFYPRKSWGNTDQRVGDFPPPALSEPSAAPSAQLIPLHCPQPGHGLQGTGIGKCLLDTARDTLWPDLLLRTLKKMCWIGWWSHHIPWWNRHRKHSCSLLDLLDDSLSLQ